LDESLPDPKPDLIDHLGRETAAVLKIHQVHSVGKEAIA
jgi:hypothetical protein